MDRDSMKAMFRKAIFYCFVIFAGILFYYMIFNWGMVVQGIKSLFRIIMPLVDGFVLAFLLAPSINFIENRIIQPIFKKHKFSKSERGYVRVLSIIIVYFIFFTLVYEFFKLVIPEIYESISSITLQFPDYINNLQNYLNKTLERYPELEKQVTGILDSYSDPINQWLNNSVMPQVTNLVTAVTSGLFVALKTVLNFVVGFMVSIYLLYNKELFRAQFKKICYALMERKTANTFIHNMRYTNKTFSGFVIGKILDSLIVGIICLIVTSIMDIPYKTLIAVIVGVTNIIPFFGPFIGAIPSAFIILMVDPRACLYFLIFILVLQQIDGNIIGPKILGVSTGITGFWVIFSITIFGGLFGVLGWLVGVPLFAVIYATIRAYIKSRLEEKHLVSDTSAYTHMNYIDEKNKFIEISDSELEEIEIPRRNK